MKINTGDTGRRPKAALFDQCKRKGAQIRSYHVFTKMAPKNGANMHKMAPAGADAITLLR